jgi:hypothetical protein
VSDVFLNQFFRQMALNTGPFDIGMISNAASALFKRVGPGILITHSQGGGVGWIIAIKSLNVRAVIASEPGSNFASRKAGYLLRCLALAALLKLLACLYQIS